MKVYKPIEVPMIEKDKVLECIPGYEPAPCDCCIEEKNYWRMECDCSNTGDTIEAARWCARMEIADKFHKLIPPHNPDKPTPQGSIGDREW